MIESGSEKLRLRCCARQCIISSSEPAYTSTVFLSQERHVVPSKSRLCGEIVGVPRQNPIRVKNEVIRTMAY